VPTYDYVCDACEHTFEEFQNFNDEVLSRCPRCGKKKLRRLFGSGAAILFKGSGFYETDYRSESYKAAAKKDQESAKPAPADGAAATNGTAAKTDTASTAAPAKGAGKKAKSKG
jgi:putative FmdB family regulatory protein